MVFEKYVKLKPHIASPRANLNKIQMILSAAAAGMIDDDIRFVQLYFDRESRTIAIEPLAGEVTGCSKLIRGRNTGNVSFTMASFYDHFEVTERGSYPVWNAVNSERGWLMIDLTKPLQSRRRKAGK